MTLERLVVMTPLRAPTWERYWLAVSSWCALSSLVHTIVARTRADSELLATTTEDGLDRTLTISRTL